MNLSNKKKTHLLLIGMLTVATFAKAQPLPIDFSRGRPVRPDAIIGERSPRADRDARMNPHEGPNPARIIGHLFRKYDLDDDGELAGLELGNATLDMAVQRPHRPAKQDSGPLDLKSEAESLENRLLRDFDLDENGGISVKELLIALEAMRPPMEKPTK